MEPFSYGGHRGLIRGLVMLATLLSLDVRAQDKTADSWSLRTQWGNAKYRECSLTVQTFQGNGRAEIRCTPYQKSPKEISAQRKLTDAEIERVRRLAERSDLYDGGHIGGSNMDGDGQYETLTVSCCGRFAVVVLVTSFNDTFGDRGSRPRHEFIQLLHKWQAELQKVAEQSVGRTRLR